MFNTDDIQKVYDKLIDHSNAWFLKNFEENMDDDYCDGWSKGYESAANIMAEQFPFIRTVDTMRQQNATKEQSEKNFDQRLKDFVDGIDNNEMMEAYGHEAGEFHC